MITPIIFLIIGLIGLYLGSGIVVESAKKIAVILNISETLIGLTIISIGTSIPEIFTNIFSGIKTANGIDASGIAIGTNLGSDITQITFILGLAALLGTMYATKKLLRRDGIMILFSIIAVFIVGITGYKVSYIEGIILLIIYAIYMFIIGKDEKAFEKIANHHKKIRKGKIVESVKDFVIIAIGIAILIYASNLVVNNALKLSSLWDVSQSFIGVVIIGVGTGLPELSTAIRAIIKKAHGISVGTIIGSNITDPMLSLPLGAIFSGSVGLTFEKNLLFFDIPFWFFASVIALLLLKRNMKIGKEEKKEGFMLIGIYILFIFLKLRFFMK